MSCSFPCRLFVSGVRVEVVRAFASYQWGPGSNRDVDNICGLKLLLILSLTGRGFFLGTPVFLPLPKLTFPNSISTRNGRRRTKNNVDMLPLNCYSFILQNFNSLRQLKRSSRVDIPQWLLDILTPMKDDDTAVINYGIKYAAEMCKQLLESGQVHGLHLYTLNRETSVSEILKKLCIYHMTDEQDSGLRKFPWMPGPALARRGRMEHVRPIFWTSRPRSYMIRTSDWDEYPNGRWGDSSAASFGELKDYHLALLGTHKSQEELMNMWGRELNSVEDVCEIFVCYLTGKKNRHGFQVSTFLCWFVKFVPVNFKVPSDNREIEYRIDRERL